MPGAGADAPVVAVAASSASRGSVASRELGVCHSSSSPAFDVDGPGVLGADDDAGDDAGAGGERTTVILKDCSATSLW